MTMGNMPYKEITSEDLINRLKQDKLLEIIDVREPEEWESGHIPTAKHIPLGELAERMSELQPDKETILVCRSGRRSTMACEYLSQLGYHVVNLTGGMMSWTGETK
jgi:rhodanese-related sulfurtransferase